MINSLNDLHPADGDRVEAGDIPVALTAAPFNYDDGGKQVFNRDGSTTYTENGSPTLGEWYLDDDQRFCSYWPPSYRACYDLSWSVKNDQIVGVRFSTPDGHSVFTGRYGH